jgi:hypothetical protein
VGDTDDRDDHVGDAERDGDRLHQPEDDATEHALRLMNEALRQSDAGRRWLVSENP